MEPVLGAQTEQMLTEITTSRTAFTLMGGVPNSLLGLAGPLAGIREWSVPVVKETLRSMSADPQEAPLQDSFHLWWTGGTLLERQLTPDPTAPVAAPVLTAASWWAWLWTFTQTDIGEWEMDELVSLAEACATFGDTDEEIDQRMEAVLEVTDTLGGAAQLELAQLVWAAADAHRPQVRALWTELLNLASQEFVLAARLASAMRHCQTEALTELMAERVIDPSLGMAREWIVKDLAAAGCAPRVRS